MTLSTLCLFLHNLSTIILLLCYSTMCVEEKIKKRIKNNESRRGKRNIERKRNIVNFILSRRSPCSSDPSSQYYSRYLDFARLTWIHLAPFVGYSTYPIFAPVSIVSFIQFTDSTGWISSAMSFIVITRSQRNS